MEPNVPTVDAVLDRRLLRRADTGWAGVQYCAPPRLRKEWDSLHRKTSGRVTVEESLWVVIITMAVAGMRDRILQDHDVERYVLHFFVVWSVLMSSLKYAGRFNDHDLWHQILWACFTIGLLFMIAYLYKELKGLMAAACFLHLLMCVTYARLALLLPRARFYGTWHAFESLLHVVLFGSLLLQTHGQSVQRMFFWINVFLEPFTASLFKVVVALMPHTQHKLDIPGDFDYLLGRYEGYHMMIIVCSFLFPIALQGSLFMNSTHSAAIVLLGTLHAIFLKLSFRDTHAGAFTRDPKGHPMRRGKVYSRFFFFAFPCSILSIALTGVGFIDAIASAGGAVGDHDFSFGRSLLCIGAFGAWATLTFLQAIHKVAEIRTKLVDVAFSCAFVLAFLIPLILELDPVASVTTVVGVQLAILLYGVFRAVQADASEWKMHTPRMLQELGQLEQGASVAISETREKLTISSQEHLFTVLLAVAVFAINEDLGKSKRIDVYIIKFYLMLLPVLSTIRYASHFNDEDLAHKLLWSVFLFIFVLQLEGLASDPDLSTQYSLFKLATMAIFLWTALGFRVRVAWSVERARRFVMFFFGGDVLISALCFASGASSVTSITFGFLWLCVVVGVFEWHALYFALNFLLRWSFEDRMNFIVPTSIDYVDDRFKGLDMEVLGVAIIVPNAFCPHEFKYASLVFVGDLASALLAVFLKQAIFDADDVTEGRHALKRSQVSFLVFNSLQHVMILAISALGGSMRIMVPLIGEDGPSARDGFAEIVFCVSYATFWACQTGVKLSHAPDKPLLHYGKAIITAVGGLCCVLPLALGLSSLATLVLLTSLGVAIPVGQLILKAAYS